MDRISREPAVLLALVAALVQSVSAFIFPLTVDQQGVINVVAVAVAGVLTALAVKGEKLLAAIIGLAQALVAAGAAFHLQLAAEQQSALMATLTIIVGMWLRTQVVAHEPPVTTRAVAISGDVAAEDPERDTVVTPA